MNKEFHHLDEYDYQREFLADWYSPKKLFIGKRGSGKSTLILCELRRFQRNGLSCLLIAPSEAQLRRLESEYLSQYKERITCETATVQDLERGSVRGFRVDAILIDEIQETTFDYISDNLIPMNPDFIRASADEGSLGKVNYLHREPGFFDSVYRSG